jgi:hypothetical protein
MRFVGIGIIFAIVLAPFLAGCADQGAPIDQSKLSLLQAGHTTRADVEGSFGPPDTVDDFSDHHILVYSHNYVQLNIWAYIPIVQFIIGGFNTQRQSFQVVIDGKDIVESYILKQYSGTSTIWSRQIQEQPTTQPIN